MKFEVQNDWVKYGMYGIMGLSNSTNISLDVCV